MGVCCNVLETEFSLEYQNVLRSFFRVLLPVVGGFSPEYFNDTSTPAPTASAVQSSSSGYGSGSMAGLAIPMLIIAIAAGGGAVYFYIRKQRLRGNDSNYIMKFVQ
uniref:Uncharacterized protein n=1 Tax=Strigamia maritima TaxID=126957 RepID=T1ILD7_STRMM